MDPVAFGAPFWAMLLLLAGGAAALAAVVRRWRRAERALAGARAERDRFAAIVAASSDWSWEQDAAFRFTFMADSVEAVLGVPAAEMLGKTRWELFPDAADDATIAEHRAVLERREPFRGLRQQSRYTDGSPRHYIVDGDPYFDTSGRFAGYRGVGRDISRLVAAEQAAAGIRERFISALNAFTEGISFWDSDERLRFFNAAFREFSLGSESSLYEGVHFNDYIREGVYKGMVAEAVGREAEWIAERIRRREQAPSGFDLRRGERWLRVTEFRTADGWVLHTAHDITELKAREVALREAVTEAEIANRAKLEFLAVMSHELRTPLNAIIGFSDVIRNRVQGDDLDTYTQYADHIHESGTHLLELINDLLDVARIETGRLKLEESDFDLQPLVAGCLRMLRVQADDNGVALALDAPDAPVGLHADQRAVKQIVLNLLSNAIKFTETGGRVRVGCGLSEDEGVRITVADSGIGIPEAEQQAVFKPFEQLERAHTRRHQGTGLGLFISRNLVEAHGGAIRLESAVGVGTTVTVEFGEERRVRLDGPPAAAAMR